MNSKVKKVLDIVLDIVIVLVMVFSVLILVLALTQKQDDVSLLFGYSLRSVQSDSMQAYDDDGNLVEGGFCKGDIILVKKPDTHIFEVGDGVMFKMPVVADADGNVVECDKNSDFEHQVIVTHSIIEVVKDGATTKYRTQGLATIAADINLKTSGEILAVYTGFRIPGVGTAIDFLKTPVGFFCCILLPMFAFVVFQSIRVIRNFIAYKAQKATAQAVSGELTEEQKRMIAEEYMRSVQNSESDDNINPQRSDTDTE